MSWSKVKGWRKRKDGVRETILVSDYLVFTFFSVRHYARRRWRLSSLSVPDQGTYLGYVTLSLLPRTPTLIQRASELNTASSLA